jgi:hypothetical protein
MDKKPLIVVSICAVVLLVLGSLSNVVGYQSVKSTETDSPLFQTRAERATNQQTNSITSQYLGMEKGNLWQIPMSNNKTELLKKAFDAISKMDDKTFERFKEVCIQIIRKNNSFKDTKPSDITQALKLMKTKSVTIINPFLNRINQSITSGYTICYWILGCIPTWIIMICLLLLTIFTDFPNTIACYSYNYMCLLGKKL